MAFPNDLSDVVVFKIHPAIGVARVSLSDDYYVFGKDPGNYKSNDIMKRQAVQFRLFAYGDNHAGLGELTADVMAKLGISAVWSARVGNRKIARQENTPLGGTAFVASAQASSDDASGGTLTATLPDFEEGAAIPLGQITSTGLFIPPKGHVFRRKAADPLPPFPGNKNVIDTVGDGVISVKLTQKKDELASLPACIVIAPQDFSPDVDPAFTLLDFLKDELHISASTPKGNLHNQTARAIDEAALKSGTQAFDPGFEVCLADRRSEVVDLQSIFYRTSDDPRIDPAEIRVRYKTAPSDPGAVPGQLTSGLCSPWQSDFTLCVGYWGEHLPTEAYLDEDTSQIVAVYRKEYADFGGTHLVETTEDFVKHVDEVGVVRLRNNKPTETERDPGDDIVG